jgi:thymidylate synthase ThyX
MSESKGKEIQKWADEAMFKAEPLDASQGPKVYLLWATPDPLGAVAAMAKMYKGEVVRNMADITDDERRAFFEQIEQTKLKAPYEAVKFHFLLEGVTRAFTHQLVRQRTAVYAQESLRFAVKEDMAAATALPPSLLGTQPWEEFVEQLRRERQAVTVDDLQATYAASKEQRWRKRWDEAVNFTSDTYNWLVNDGMPAEDARGLAPTNITTRVEYVTDLRSLLDHGGNRLCTQAQFEWKQVWAQIIKAIRTFRPSVRHGFELDGRPGSAVSMEGWQFEEISKLFKPACYLTGKCEFAALDLDRKCSIRSRVEANHHIGRDSSEWGTEWEHPDASKYMMIGAPQGGQLHTAYEEGTDRPLFIGGIQPREWAADPGAAR